MKILKDVLICVLLSAVSALFVFLIVLVRDADKTINAVPAEITDIKLRTLAEVHSDIESTRRELLATVNTQATAIRKTADNRLQSIQNTADNRLQAIQQVVDARLGEVTAQVAKVQEDLHPVLANAAASINPEDIKGTVRDTRFLMARAARTAGHIEQMSDAIQKATPEVTQSVVGIGKSADGIAKDVKREADVLTAPKPWYSKILGPIYTVGRLIAPYL